MKSKEFQDDVRHGSEMWPDQKSDQEVGDFDARNYSLIQEFDPKKVGDCE